MDIVQRRYGVKGAMIDTLKQSARLGDMIAIGGLGFLFCLYHTTELTQDLTRAPTAVEWAVITIGIGAVLGGLFTIFIGPKASQADLLLPLMGIITFASGAAFFLDLSPLLVNLVLGMVLVNTARSTANRADCLGNQVRQTLEGTSRPIFLILLIFAGALWEPPPVWPTIIVIAGLIVLRIIGKMGFLWRATVGTDLRRDTYRGLIGQGHGAVAMALSFRLVFFESPAAKVAYSAILASVVLNELIAPRILKGLLVDAGIIRREAQAGQ